MKKLITLFIAAALAASAAAITITYEGTFNGNTTKGSYTYFFHDGIVDALCPPDADGLKELKAETENAWADGGLTVDFSTDPDTWSFAGSSYSTINLLGFALKTSTGFELYSISGFIPGTDVGPIDITFEELTGSLSHFSLFYKEVPDSGTTLALLGAALLGVIGFRRFKK